MSKNPSADLRMTVYAALFTALVIIGGYISIPIGPVPIALADFFIMLAALFLGARWGLASTGLYVFLGALGLPVYAGGKAGLAILFGPTGGFLFGYLALVLVAGFISGSGKQSLLKNMAALTAGNILLFAIGVTWLKVQMSLAWGAALSMGLIPFIPGNIIKIIAALAIAKVFVDRFRQTITASARQGD